MPKEKSLLREYTEAIILALIAALLIRATVVQAFRIPSGSMIPTLLVGDQILVDKLAYKFRKPQRGDIMVFKYPKDESRDFIKRVIGLPGDKLEIKSRKVYVNGEPINEDAYAYHEFADLNTYPHPRDNFGPVTIPEKSYFVMGDNRENSMDSRFWGFLDEENLVGRAFIIYWSRDVKENFPFSIRLSRFGYLIQ